MAFTTLTMNRTGRVCIETFGPNHCGLKDRIIVDYRCEVTILSEFLDDQGFMIDQLKIAAAFESLKRTDLSCELLSRDMARRVFKMLLGTPGGEEKILRIACTISPMPEASMTFVWQKYQVCVK